MTQPEKWTRAVQQAIAADLIVHCTHGTPGTVKVPSEVNHLEQYVVTLEGGKVGRCSCTAGSHGRPCKHRAAVAIRLFEREAGVRVNWIRNASGIEKYLGA